MQSNNHPTVSVIIPVFNGARYIRGAIESVLSQTFQDFEVVVVDDGSTDNTKEVLEPWIKEGKIKYIYQQNKGLAGARNTGIRLAKGKFLKFLDSDDFLYPQQLERQVNHLKNKPECIISVTDYDLEFDSKNRKSIKTWLGRKSQLACFIEGNPCPPNIILVRRSIVEQQGGFDEGLFAHEDTDLWLRILIQGGIFEKVDYIGCCYRILGTSISADSYKMFTNNCKVFEKLNRSLLPQLNQLHREAIHQLFLSNIQLIYQSFARKIKPASCLSITLKSSSAIYSMKADWFRRFLLRTLGIQNIAFLKYWAACLINKNYHAKLLNACWWRDERNYR